MLRKFFTVVATLLNSVSVQNSFAASCFPCKAVGIFSAQGKDKNMGNIPGSTRLTGYKSGGSKISGFRHHSIPCPNHPNAKASTHHRVCTECTKEYKRLVRAKFGIPLKDEFSSDRASARRRGLEWELSFDNWLAIISQPCVYGGCQGGLVSINRGIDRKENDKGYVAGNCQACCWLHNRFKSDILTHEQMLDASSRYGIACGNAPRRAR